MKVVNREGSHAHPVKRAVREPADLVSASPRDIQYPGVHNSVAHRTHTLRDSVLDVDVDPPLILAIALLARHDAMQK